MKQADLGLSLTTKKTRKREFLVQMERVVPWAALVGLVLPYAPAAKTGRPPFPVETMLRIHFMQQWFTLSDPAMEEALHDVPLFREFANLGWDKRLPDESTILRFRHLLEAHKLAEPILATVNELLRDKVEHPFRVVKRQFGHVKVRYRGLKKNTAQLVTLFALSNLWMARRALLALDGQLRPKAANAA